MEKSDNAHYSERHLLETSDALYALQQQNKYIDLMIVCKGDKIPAHRFILASASPFFEKVLLEDSKKNDISIMEVENVEPKIMELLMTFVYLGNMRIEDRSSPDELMDIMTAAHHVQLDELVTTCGRILLHNYPEFSIDLLWMWAEKNDSQMMRNIITENISEDYDNMHKMRVFLDLPFSAALATIEKMPRVTSAHNEGILNAAVAWVNHSLSERQQYLTDLTSRIQMDMLSHTFVNEKVQLLPALRLVQKFFGFLPEGSFESIVERPGHATPRGARGSPKRKGDSEGERSGRSSHSLLLPNCSRSLSKSRKKHRILSPETNHAKLVVVGSDAHGQLITTTCALNKGEMWSSMEHVGLPSINATAYTMYRDNILFIGGETSSVGKLNTVYLYNMSWKTLSEGPPLRIPRSAIGVTLNGDTAYLYGGSYKIGQRGMQYAELYNISLNKYEVLPRLRYKHNAAAGAMINNRLYVIGGGTGKCESICPHRPDGGWTDIACLPDMLSKAFLHVTAHDSMLYAFRNERISHLYYYNPIRNAWKVVKVKGDLPESIVSIFTKGFEIWAIDKNGLVFTFDLRNNTWEIASGTEPTNSLYPHFMTLWGKV